MLLINNWPGSLKVRFIISNVIGVYRGDGASTLSNAQGKTPGKLR